MARVYKSKLNVWVVCEIFKNEYNYTHHDSLEEAFQYCINKDISFIQIERR